MENAIEIKLYDAIGYGGITASALAAQIPADAEHVTLRINSPGGDVADGLAMYHYLADHPARVTTIVDGYAASAASVVMLAGDERIVHEAAIVMVHNPWSIGVGDAEDMRHAADVLDEHADAILDIYARRTGLPRNKLAAMMKQETWMRGRAAVAQGFADTLAEDHDQAGKRSAGMAHACFARVLAAMQRGDELMDTPEQIEEQPALDDAEAQAVEASVTDAADDEPQGKPKTRREALARVEALHAEVAALTAAREAAEQRATDAEALANDRAGQVEALTQRVTDIEASLIEAKELANAAQTRGDELQAEVEAVRKALAQPQIADAVLQPFSGSLAVLEAPADAEADAAERSAADADGGGFRDVADEYEAMEPGDERRAFWTAHKRQILAAIAAREDNINTEGPDHA